MLASLSNKESGTYDGIRCKEYGKAKIFFADQDQLSDFTHQQLADLQEENTGLKALLDKNEAEERKFRSQLSSLISRPLDAELGRYDNDSA